MSRLLCWLFALLLPLTATAEEEVDVELLFMVDVSLSMSEAELEIQRRGYAEALASDEVLAAIQSGFLGSVAVAYVEWAGIGAQRVVVDWRRLQTREDALTFKDLLDANFPIGMRRTSISGALDAGRQMIETNAYKGLRRVIDISGDGPNNQGGLVTSARDRALEAGIVINGLPLMTFDGPYGRYNIPDLDRYYADCVIGGPGSFVLPVYHWDDFAEAIRRKIVLELVGPPAPQPRVIRAQFSNDPAYDCLIGEKLWQQNRGLRLP